MSKPKPSNLRIYAVKSGGIVRLIRAPNKAQAIRHVAEATILCDIATQDEIFSMAAAGVKVENATEAPVEQGNLSLPNATTNGATNTANTEADEEQNDRPLIAPRAEHAPVPGVGGLQDIEPSVSNNAE